MARVNLNLKQILILVLFLLHLFLLLRVRLLKALFFGSIKFLDFDNYYWSLKDILAGQHPYQLPYMQTLGPPLVYVFFLPFVWLPLNLARSLITGLNLFGAYFSSYLLAKKFVKKEKLIMTLILSLMLLSSFTARFNLLMGQPNLIITLSLTIFLLTKKSYLQGLSLALVAVIKTYLGFIAGSLVRFKRKSFLWFVIFFSFLFCSALLIIKPNFYTDYFQESFLNIAFKPTSLKNLDYYNQSLKSTLSRLGMEQTYFYFYSVSLILGGIYLVFSGNQLAAIPLSLLLSPVCWQHYFVILFPVIIKLFYDLWMKKDLKGLILWSIAFFFWWIERPWLHSGQMNFLNGLLASHYFLSSLIFLFLALKKK